MKTSNISYLRKHLSEVLSCVKEGETVLVLDRKKPVARLSPYVVEEDPGEDRLRELQRLGLVTREAAEEKTEMVELMKPARPVDVVRFILEDREGE